VDLLSKKIVSLMLLAFLLVLILRLAESKVLVSSVVLPISHESPNETSLATYQIYNTAAIRNKSLPTIFLLNGFNVASKYYLNVVRKLAAAGYVVATASETRPLPFPIPGLPLPGCSSNYTLITGAYLNVLFSSTSVNSGVRLFHRSSILNGIMLLGHSNGGAVAVAIAAGLCGTVANRTVDPMWVTTCDGYVPIVSKGRDLILGAVVHEGYVTAPITLSNSTAISYTAGQYNNATYNAYLDTTGKFKSFTRLDNANHYAICDFVVGVNGSQVTPCALKARSDPLDYKTTASQVAGFNDKIVTVAIETIETITRYNRPYHSLAPNL
jgi:hypothetical protein